MKHHILIATDVPGHAAGMESRLRAAGFDLSVSTVSTREEFQGLAAGAAPDLVLLDSGLIGWNAEEAMKEVLKSFPASPCLVMDGAARMPEGFEKLVPAVAEAAPAPVKSAGGLSALVYSSTVEGELNWAGVEGDVEAVTGYKKEDFIKDVQLWRRNVRPDDHKSGEKRLKDLLESGRYEGEYRWLRADGSWRWFIDKQRLERGPEGAPLRVAGVIVDITESKNAESRIGAEKKMEAIGRLAGGLAHDFHNLLSSVLGYSTLMLGNMGQSDPLRADLNEIYKAAERAVVLTRQLLVFSKKQSFQPQPVDINSIFTGIQTMLRQLMRDDIRGISDLQEGLKPVNADLVQLEQVIVALAMHLCESIPPGGSLTVSTRAAEVTEEYCRGVAGSSAGEYIRLSVAGTGKALEKESLEALFEPYAAGQESRLRSGLTMPAVYGIIRQHGGWITAASAEGSGTVFDVYLPLQQREPAAQDVEAREPVCVRKIGGNGERILLVEDEEALRRFVTRVLSENGYTVFAAGSVAETLEIFRKEKGNFHLVFTDVSLPDKTGVQLAEELLAIKPALKIIFNSGYVNEKSQWPDIQRKGLKFLQKPYTIHNMLAAIKEVIKRPEV